jgi:amino acid/amide ABC transporter substrate-binding protein, HAAT family (TC 3.A.1.4.-)
MPPELLNVAWQNDTLHEAAGMYANQAGYKKSFMLAPNYPAGQDALTGYKRFLPGGGGRALHQARPKGLRGRDRANPGVGCR